MLDKSQTQAERIELPNGDVLTITPSAVPADVEALAREWFGDLSIADAKGEPVQSFIALITAFVAQRATAPAGECEVLREALLELQNLNDQEGSTLRDTNLSASDRKRYLTNNVVETERVILKALAIRPAPNDLLRRGVTLGLEAAVQASYMPYGYVASEDYQQSIIHAVERIRALDPDEIVKGGA